MRDVNVVDDCMHVCENEYVSVNVHGGSRAARVVGVKLPSAEARGKLI